MFDGHPHSPQQKDGADMRSLLQDDTKSAHKKLACLAECVLKPMCPPAYLATPSGMAKFGQLAMAGEWVLLVCFVNVHK